MIYALDTNTLIFLLNRDEKIIKNRDKTIITGDRFIIPPIVDCEVQRGLLYKILGCFFIKRINCLEIVL